MLTNKQLAALRWAVGEAEAWRGSLVGNPDTTMLEQFDATVKLAKAALKQLREEKKRGKAMQ